MHKHSSWTYDYVNFKITLNIFLMVVWLIDSDEPGEILNGSPLIALALLSGENILSCETLKPIFRAEETSGFLKKKMIGFKKALTDTQAMCKIGMFFNLNIQLYSMVQ